jgi:hypothetical protein
MDFIWTPTTKYHRKSARKNLFTEVVHIVYMTIGNGKLDCGKKERNIEQVFCNNKGLLLHISRHIGIMKIGSFSKLDTLNY